MERLVTTTQASEILGLSLQGIHYRIKKNQLKSIKQNGKTFVYIDDSSLNQINNIKNEQINSPKKVDLSALEAIIEVKDEQIDLLKKSMKWMKKQYISEIARLEKNQKRIIEVFNSEIKLLQSAFNEMRSIYKPQIQNINSQQNKTFSQDERFINIKDFFVLMKRKDKSEQEIKYLIFKAIRKGDKRFIYNKKDKKLLILNDSFEDLI